MPYRLSILDKALVPEGTTPQQSLAETVASAQLADRLGFHRYWFAEHHGMPALGSTAPEALAAYVLASTQRIRVGSGGVMLQHYAPFKVAETFNLLAALAPGRVDLGIGKAPGGLPRATRALRSGLADAQPDFADKLRELDAFVFGRLGDEHPLAGALAGPAPAVPPAPILLGASAESAALAAELDWGFCYAGHFDGDPDRMAHAFRVYREATGRTPLLALVAFAAPSEAEAQRLVGPLRLYRVRLATGQKVNVGTPEAAAEFARQSGVADYSVEEIVPNVISGTGAQVRAALDEIHGRLGVEEFVMDAPVAAHDARRASLEELARAILPHVGGVARAAA
ncbi:MsnO8 family LLM class oxidoreductase [Sphingomonas sp. TX0543]|uniref:MsnO8 family LLM class oxidoreductase n=1 Tax=unclassified Sphingomonas TaxID=196159 RepID=UPI0010F551F0|nr:MsnO8 family LLM class oxidoreductase [Sphingomonas sp. 3P27F8]